MTHLERVATSRGVTKVRLDTRSPDIRLANVASSTRYLVTMRLPRRLDGLPYPETLQYHRRGVVMTTAPRIQVRSWPEEVVHLTAHEARHVHQFRHGLPKSEVDAERWAAAAVLRFRAAPPPRLSHPRRRVVTTARQEAPR